MIQLTLVNEENAEEGRRFIYLGPQLLCKECKIKDICLNLDKGSEYRVKKVRKPVHDCALIDGPVRVVEVEKVPRSVAVEKKVALEGSKITFAPAGCGRVGCVHYRECNPDGLERKTKVTIEKVGDTAECPMGESRVVVTIL